MNDPLTIRPRLANPDTRTQAALEIGDWMRALCLLFGTEFKTACIVGALFATGIERSWSEQ